MSMFTNYENSSYTAYNLTPPKESNIVRQYLYSPIVGYDNYGNIRSFIWDPEDEFNLNLKLGLKVYVFEDSILYESTNSHPTQYTIGYKGQKAYNLVDGKSWTCKGTLQESLEGDEWIPLSEDIDEDTPEWLPLTMLKTKFFAGNIDQLDSSVKNELTTDEQQYVWEEDIKLDFPNNGTKEVLVSPNMENKTLLVTFMNFRHEVIYSYTFENSNVASILINKESTPLLVEGQYFINVYVKDSTLIQNSTQYNVTIMENPVKYVEVLNNRDENVSYKYKEETTIQEQPDNSFIWEPLYGSGDNDYVWIPL